jgi:PHD/YefM family antitoxin component YafN of YafNO toxin-antitoxin module
MQSPVAQTPLLLAGKEYPYSTKRPVVLTVNGKAAAIVQDAEAYQRLLDIAASANEEEAIRQGLEDVKQGRTRPAREFFAEFEAKHGIRR